MRRFALGDYLQALTAGGALDAAQRHAVAEKLSGYIGLPVPYLEKAELRIYGPTFGNQLLADEGKTIGRLDTRYSGPSLDRLAKDATYDPQASAISSAYVSVYNDYARNVLKFGAELTYKPGIDVEQTWDFKHQPPGADQPFQATVNVIPDLATAMLTNPRLKVALFAGLYDLATPFFSAEYELSHLPVPPALRANIEAHHYPAGHMMYDDPPSLARLHDDVARFVRAASAP